MDQARGLGVCACRLQRDPLDPHTSFQNATLEKLRHVAELGFAEQNHFTAPHPVLSLNRTEFLCWGGGKSFFVPIKLLFRFAPF